MNKLIVTLCEDGSVKTNATGMKGSAASILKELNSLASALGGELVVEEHVHGAHTHTHEDEEDHHRHRH